MIRTINEHHRAAKRLFELAKVGAAGKRARILRLAQLNLLMRKAQLANPALRPGRAPQSVL